MQIIQNDLSTIDPDDLAKIQAEVEDGLKDEIENEKNVV